MRWPPAQEFMKKIRRPYTGPDKRTKWEYPCSNCLGWFKVKDVKRDHIDPVGGFSTTFEKWWVELGEIARKMFCDENGFQLLCKECHTIKSEEERKTGAWKRT